MEAQKNCAKSKRFKRSTKFADPKCSQLTKKKKYGS